VAIVKEELRGWCTALLPSGRRTAVSPTSPPCSLRDRPRRTIGSRQDKRVGEGLFAGRDRAGWETGELEYDGRRAI
jgi:hypothetical protein